MVYFYETGVARSERDAIQLGGLPFIPHALCADISHGINMSNVVSCCVEIRSYQVSRYLIKQSNTSKIRSVGGKLDRL